MNVEQIVSYMRLCVRIQDPDGAEIDSKYLSMTDEDILLYLNVALTRDFPTVPSLDTLPNADIYPLTLLARKDLYYTLATIEAPLYDLGADNNNYLKRSQRFDHYMKLIVQVDKEYQDYIENGGAGGNTLNAYNVILPNRYNTRYNRENGAIPCPILYLQNVGIDFVEVSWQVKMSRFYMYRVYVSESQIIDLYVVGNHVISDSTLVTTIRDIHQTGCRIEGLLPNTEYHVAVAAVEMSSLTGYNEVVFTTLSDEPEEPPEKPEEPPTDNEGEDQDGGGDETGGEDNNEEVTPDG